MYCVLYYFFCLAWTKSRIDWNNYKVYLDTILPLKEEDLTYMRCINYFKQRMNKKVHVFSRHEPEQIQCVINRTAAAISLLVWRRIWGNSESVLIAQLFSFGIMKSMSWICHGRLGECDYYCPFASVDSYPAAVQSDIFYLALYKERKKSMAKDLK